MKLFSEIEHFLKVSVYDRAADSSAKGMKKQRRIRRFSGFMAEKYIAEAPMCFLADLESELAAERARKRPRKELVSALATRVTELGCRKAILAEVDVLRFSKPVTVGDAQRFTMAAESWMMLDGPHEEGKNARRITKDEAKAWLAAKAEGARVKVFSLGGTLYLGTPE